MKTKLSGLMDGELAEHEAQALFAAIRQDDELRNRWIEYQVIGDALKGESNLDAELTGRVMAALENEPTGLAPKISSSPPRRDPWHRHLLALAATVAGVTVVAWLALGIGRSPQPDLTAQNQVGKAAVAKNETVGTPVGQTESAGVSVRMASPDMQEYLIAHEAQSSLLQFRGGAEHIRTVAAVGMAPAK